MEIKINKEIKEYNETMFFGLSVRQFMLVVLDSILNRITENRAKGRKTYIFIDETLVQKSKNGVSSLRDSSEQTQNASYNKRMLY